MLSYTKPRKKTIFTPEMQLVVSFFSITIVMLFLTYGFLLYKDYRFKNETDEMLKKQQELQNDIDSMDIKIKNIEKEMMVFEKITTKNSVLKESIANLFDLIPQKITLSEANLLENGLILYGITPNKDVYNFMLQAPLRSIFHRTYTSFYEQQNGWLRFVSKNYMINDEDEIENDTKDGESNED